MLPIRSCSDVSTRSRIFPDLGKVGSDTHWVKPKEMKALKNVVSRGGVCTVLGSDHFKHGKLKSPNKTTSLSRQYLLINETSRLLSTGEFDGGLYTTAR